MTIQCDFAYALLAVSIPNILNSLYTSLVQSTGFDVTILISPSVLSTMEVACPLSLYISPWLQSIHCQIKVVYDYGGGGGGGGGRANTK